MFNLTLGWVYKFQFAEGFESLDGTYVLVQDLTYAELLDGGNSLYDSLYQYVNKSQSELEASVNLYKTDVILKLISTDEKTQQMINSDGTSIETRTNLELYVPKSLIKDVPIFNVNLYKKLVVGINVGIYPGESDLDYIKNNVNDELNAVLGYTNPSEVISIDKVWLTDDEYTALQLERDANKTKIVNYFSENNRLRSEIDRLKEIIKQQNTLILTLTK